MKGTNRTRRMVIALGLAGGLAAGAAGLAVAGLVMLPGLVRPRVDAWITEQLDARLAATVEVGDVELGLWSSWPRLEARVTDLRVVGKAPFEGLELARVGEVRLGLDVMSVLLGAAIEVETLAVHDAHLTVRVDEEGRANYDILKDQVPADPPQDAGGPTNLLLDDVALTGIHLSYQDAAADRAVEIVGLDHTLSGALIGGHTQLATHTEIGSLTVRDGAITWLRDTRWVADVALAVDASTGAVRLGDNRVAVNALAVAFSGLVAPKGDDFEVDLKFETAETSFKSLLSLVPAAYTPQFDAVKAGGTLALSGAVAGRVAAAGDTLPRFDLAVEVRDGSLQYPDLPGSVQNIALDLTVRHPGGAPDLAEIDVDRYAMTVAGATIGGSLKVRRPVSDPAIDLAARGRLDLGALAKAYPVPDTTLSGVMDVDAAIAGRTSDFAAQNTDAVRAEGTFEIKGMRVTSASVGVETFIDVLSLTLSPQHAQVKTLALRWGKSDLAATGRFDNLVPYLVGQDALVGTLTLTSRHLDLRPFQGEPTDAPAEEQEAVLVAIPADLDLDLQAKAGKLITTELDLDDVSAAVRVENSALHIDRMAADMLGGRVVMSGVYTAPTARSADLSLSIDALRFDVERTMANFDVLGRIVPMARDLPGRFDSLFELKTTLARDGTPDLQVLSSSGMLIPTKMLLQPAVLGGVARELGGGGTDRLDLGGARIGYKIRKGQAALEPFKARLGPVPASIRGTADLEAGTMDLVIDCKVPARQLQKTALAGQLPVKLPKDIDVVVRITGSFAKPKAQVSIKGADGIVDAVKAELADAAGQGIDAALAQARKAGDLLVAEAEKRAAELRAAGRAAAEKIRAEGKKQADKLTKEAKGNPLKEKGAKIAADKIRKDSDKQADKVQAEADKQADRAVTEARAQRDKLLADASAKSHGAVKKTLN